MTALFSGERNSDKQDRRLDWNQSQSGQYGEVKHFSPSGNLTPAVETIHRRYTD
jgi:hypothetical protein